MKNARASREALYLAVMLLSSVASAQQFDPPVALNANPSTDDAGEGGVRVACGADGTCVAVWSNTALERNLVARSVDGGRTWSPQHLLFDVKQAYGGVNLATDRLGHWVAVWTYGPGLQGSADVWTSHSDDGDTWSAPVSLGTPGGDDLSPSIASDGSGAFVALWTFIQNAPQSQRWAIHARSTDGGANWDVVSSPITDGPAGTIAGGGGTLVAVWGSAPVYYSRSTDGGATWTPRLVLDDDESHSATGGALATDRHGAWVVALDQTRSLPSSSPVHASSESDLVYVRSEDDALTWSAPGLLNTNAESDGRNDDANVRVAANEHGVWAAVWEGDLGPRSGGADGDILVAWSHDGARTWETPQALNRTATDDTGQDGGPDVTDAPGGAFLGGWSGYGLDGGTDSDPYVARASCGCAPCDVCSLDGSCVPTARGDCIPLGASDSAKLSITDPSGSAKDQLTWKLILGAPQAAFDLDDPRADGSVALCVYGGDGQRIFRGTAEAGLACGRDTCWTKRSKTVTYARADGAPDGIVRAASRAGSDGRARVTMVGQGKNLTLPALPLPLPLVTQLQIAGGQCWQADFPAGSLTVDRAHRSVAATTGQAP